MKGIKEYITEGYFTNISSDPTKAFRTWFQQMSSMADDLHKALPDVDDLLQIKTTEYMDRETTDIFNKMIRLATKCPLNCGFIIGSKRTTYIRSSKYYPFEYCSIKNDMIDHWEISQPPYFIVASFYRDKLIPVIVTDEGKVIKLKVN